MQPGTCYVWRVWPFVGRRFTGKPLGVSNFCVASKKVLRQKAEARPAGGTERIEQKLPLGAGVLVFRHTNDPPNGGGGRVNRRIFHAEHGSSAATTASSTVRGVRPRGCRGRARRWPRRPGRRPAPPGGLGVDPASPTQIAQPSRSAGPTRRPTPVRRSPATRAASARAVGPVALGDVIPARRRRPHVHRRAVQSDGQVSALGQRPDRRGQRAADRHGRPSAARRTRPAGTATCTIAPICTDPLSPPVGGAPPFAWTTDGTGLTAQRHAAPTPRATRARDVGAFKFDATAPTACRRPAPRSRAPRRSSPPSRVQLDARRGRHLRPRPATSSRSATSTTNGAFETIARVNDAGGVGDYVGAPRPRPAPGAAAPSRHLLEWRVRTIDRAGNSRNASAARPHHDRLDHPARAGHHRRAEHAHPRHLTHLQLDRHRRTPTSGT